MRGFYNENNKILCLLKIMQDYTDSDSMLSASEILKLLKSLYDIELDRRTLWSLFESLTNAGFEIKTIGENIKTKYYLVDRVLEEGEIKLIIDAIYSFKFLSEKDTTDLVKKVAMFLPKNKRNNLALSNISKPFYKTGNREVIFNIEIISEAIQKKKQISFIYMKYDENKKLVARKDTLYQVSPHRLIFTNEHYYLIVCDKEEIFFYRIDKMKNIDILEIDSAPINEKTMSYIIKSVSAFAGNPENIVIYGNEVAFQHAIDYFGDEIKIKKLVDNPKWEYELVIKASVRGFKWWALDYLDKCEVISPQSLREEIIKIIKDSAY